MNTPHYAVRRLAVLGAVLGLCMSLRPAGGAPADEPADPDRDVHNLVLLAPEHPVFLQIRVQVDGHGLKSVRAAYAAKIVANYDKDGDGLLDREEAKNVPPLVKSPTTRDTVAIAERWEAVDTDPADDKVSVDELAAYIDRVFGNPFELTIKPQRATQGVDLFSLLDLNRDGRLSREELAAATTTLRKLDLDEDETFSIDELQPFRNPQIPQAPMPVAAQGADQPFIDLADEQGLEKIAEQLMKRYGDPESAKGLSRESLHIAEAAFAAADADGNGSLNTAELAAFLKHPAPHLVVEAQLPQKTQGRPKLAMIDDPLRAATADAKTARAGDKLALSVGGVGLQMQAVANRSTLSDSRAMIKTTKFKTADADKNGYLSEGEFGALGLPGAEFKSVDRDGDGMVTLEEVLAYIDQESASSQSRVELTVSHDGKSVFEVIDANHDRRISRRELVHAFDQLRSFDRNADECITSVELAGRFKADLGLGKPVLFRTAGGGQRGDATAPAVVAPTSGPEWFRKMDRNRDGDVSLREFLGPPALFKKLDLDGDGLISAEEAALATTAETRTTAP
ncbi:MAG: EF-hand domain-containing protein [Planctomycetia bacterium]|nr:EF-hand domain-containing protein [Planctomycetia bacterium]